MKNALVTGGDRGIGRAIVSLLARSGYRVIFTYHKRKKAAVDTTNKIRQLTPAECYQLDVTDYKKVDRFFRKLKKRIKTLDVIINNAGILGRFRSIVTITKKDWNNVINTNLTGPFYLLKSAVPLLKKGSCIINISSIAGKNGGTVGAHYAASKAGIIGLTFALARELAPKGIRVNAIAPGPVDTDLLTTQQKRRLKRLSPLKRIARPDEIAHAVKFLIENEYVTGEVLDVNAGRYMD